MWIFNKDLKWEDITERYHSGISILHPTNPTPAVLSQTERGGQPTFVLEATHKSRLSMRRSIAAEVARSHV